MYDDYMAKLYFRYGTMGSAKTMNMLAVAHNYKSQGKKVWIVKPQIDTRDGNKLIKSRSGLQAEADFILPPDQELQYVDGLSCILVDEAQFLSTNNVNNLRRLTVRPGIPVICYGLRTDFQGKAFEGSLRLFEMADSIEEIKVTCYFCNKKAIINMRIVDGIKPTIEGPQVQLGADESYKPACYACWSERIGLSAILASESRDPKREANIELVAGEFYRTLLNIFR